MPFAWNQLEPSTVGQVTKFDIPFNDWIGIKFGEGLSSGLGQAVWERGEDAAWDDGEKLDPATINKTFGIKGYLEFDTPTTVGRASLLYERKKEELQRMAYLDAASHNALSGKGVSGFVAGLVGGFANPIDLATAFIPFVGSAAKAAPLARMGRGLLGAEKYGPFGQAVRATRTRLAKGIVTQEAIGAGRGAQLSAAMIDGVLSQAAVEIPIAIQKARNQAEYGLQDSLFNVLAGGLFAGGLNLAGQALEAAYKRAIKSAVDFHVRANPETKEALFREHEDALLSGRKPDTAAIIRIDEESIRRKVEAERFDAEAAKMEGMRNEQMWTELRGEVTVAVEKASKALADGDVAGAVAAIQSLPTSGEMIGSGVDITKLMPGLKKLAQDLPDLNRVMVDDRPLSQWMNDVEVGKISSLSRYQSLTEEQLKKIIASKRPEPFKKAAREILESRQLAQDFPYQRAVETERQKRIAEFIEKKRQEWKDGLEGRVSKAKQAEIAKQQAEGKVLSKEDIAKYRSKAQADKADVEIVKQDAEVAEDDLRAEIGLPSKKPVEQNVKLPDWVNEKMMAEGKDPNRIFNEVDIQNPTVIAAIKADPTLTPEQKSSLLKTGGLPKEAAAPRRSAAIELTQEDIDGIAKELEELGMDVDSFLTQAKAVKGAAPCAAKRG